MYRRNTQDVPTDGRAVPRIKNLNSHCGSAWQFYPWDRLAIRGHNTFLGPTIERQKHLVAKKWILGILHVALSDDDFLPFDLFAFPLVAGEGRAGCFVVTLQSSVVGTDDKGPLSYVLAPTEFFARRASLNCLYYE